MINYINKYSLCYLLIFQCVERDCNIIELDVRTSRDGKLLLLHDQGLERLTGTDITNVHVMDWDKINKIDVGATHPNRFDVMSKIYKFETSF